MGLVRRHTSDVFATLADPSDQLAFTPSARVSQYLYGDLRGLPPLLIQVGSRETLLDDAVRIADKANKAGVEVEVEVWPGQIHVWQIFASRLDEGEQAIQKLGAFIRKHAS